MVLENEKFRKVFQFLLQLYLWNQSWDTHEISEWKIRLKKGDKMNTNIIQKAGKMRNGGSMLWFMNLQMDLSCEASNHTFSEVRFLFHFSLGLIITTKPCRSSKKKNHICEAIVLSERNLALSERNLPSTKQLSEQEEGKH